MNRDRKEAMDSLEMKRNGEVLRESTMDSLGGLREAGENIIGNKEWPGNHVDNCRLLTLLNTELNNKLLMVC